jgi:glycosyltransferase involved in cell wall biosynthesis
MAESEFTLCPRGYGATSFRLYEALQLDSIPVYIYDKPWIPFEELVNWEEFCVLIHIDQIEKLHKILSNISEEEREKMRIAGKKAWKKFFTLESCCKTIYNITSGRAN